MKAVVARNFGPPEAFALTIVDDPLPPGPDEVSVVIRFCAVSFVDMLIAAGGYQAKPPLPFTPGGEFAGEVIAVGAAVRCLAIGDKVVGAMLVGAFAERITVPARQLLRLVANQDLATAVAAFIPQATALHALDRGLARPGERILVLGGGGAVGLAAVQLTAMMGLIPIAMASTVAKRRAAIAAGAVAAIAPGEAGIKAALASARGEEMVDLVFDGVGGDVSEMAFRCLAPGGRHLMVGFASGAIPKLPTNLALLKEAALVGVNLGTAFARDGVAEHPISRRLACWWSQGRLRPDIRCTYPAERFAEAMRGASDRSGHGRVVLAF